MSDKWEISDDGLTYKFHIREGMKWDINTEKYTSGENKGKFKDSRLQMLGYEFNPDITANDFVFALRRAAYYVTDCPQFSLISCIKNANKIHTGAVLPTELGVVANDDYNLTITLEHKDDTFMQTLASAVAMPCNEQFFVATNGRYGLEGKYTLFNGQFYVSQILDASYLLKNNDKYTGPSPSKAKELTLKILDKSSDTDDDLVSKLESGYYDAAFITAENSDKINKDSGVTYTPYQDTTWSFVFNTNDEVFQSKTMRKAFCEGFSRPTKYDKDYLSPATNLTPSSCVINGNNAVKAMGYTAGAQNQDKSVADWKKALDILDTTDISITVLTPSYMENCVKQLLQGVQAGLGSYLTNSDGDAITLTLKVQAMDESDIRTEIAKNTYDVAFLPFTATGNSAISFMNQIASDNITDINSNKVAALVKKAQNQSNLNSAAAYLKQAEQTIINTYTVCPMIYESSYYAAANGVKNIQFHPGTGRVSFVNATRE
ncbi:MAG: ABC transporter substrate-binding protein, partial [Clostridia bacterium]|nr:ABC transporter substrate-binding protein [Clostridia bacterium]